MIYSRIYKQDDFFVWEVYKTKDLLYSGTAKDVETANAEAEAHRKTAGLPKKRTKK